ncbi:conserved hypothetical protein [Culex quinquefasciatus]|uniref:Uncharacterized protein n=1 Tax=Culex quinquefasciatus TaxID=7176 RepID=B0X6B7_CULQU|nr:conserved hypothetical protein [Culex quinquefasciatus]|eukprot:XP_001865189.1 conserved hypothetical protein [Culex quinquefasciatus]
MFVFDCLIVPSSFVASESSCLSASQTRNPEVDLGKLAGEKGRFEKQARDMLVGGGIISHYSSHFHHDYRLHQETAVAEDCLVVNQSVEVSPGPGIRTSIKRVEGGFDPEGKGGEHRQVRHGSMNRFLLRRDAAHDDGGHVILVGPIVADYTFSTQLVSGLYFKTASSISKGLVPGLLSETFLEAHQIVCLDKSEDGETSYKLSITSCHEKQPLSRIKTLDMPDWSKYIVKAYVVLHRETRESARILPMRSTRMTCRLLEMFKGLLDQTK